MREIILRSKRIDEDNVSWDILKYTSVKNLPGKNYKKFRFSQRFP